MQPSATESPMMRKKEKWQPTPVFLPGNAMARGVWWATVHGVAKSRLRLSRQAATRYWIVFFKRIDRIELSQEPEPVLSVSGVSEIASCPPSPTLHLYHRPPPIPPGACSLDASPYMQLLYCTIVLFKVLYCKI